MKKFLNLFVLLISSSFVYCQTPLPAFVTVNGSGTETSISIYLTTDDISSVTPEYFANGDELTNLNFGVSFPTDSVKMVYMPGTLSQADDTLIVNAIGTVKIFAYFPGNPVQTYQFKIENTLAIDNLLLIQNKMKIYPSPATSTTTIRFVAANTDEPINIFSLNGEMVFSDNSVRLVGSENEIELDLTKFEKGTYLVKVGELVEKFVVE